MSDDDKVEVVKKSEKDSRNDDDNDENGKEDKKHKKDKKRRRSRSGERKSIEGEEKEKKKKKKRSRSRDRKRSSSRDRKRSSRDRDRSRSRGRDRSHRDRSSERPKETDEERAERKAKEEERRAERRKQDDEDRERRRIRNEEDQKLREERRKVERAEKERKREEEKERLAHKDQYTVLVQQIHPKVDERDLFDFFSIVGTVQDIRLIRDARTNKSKGLCYVEFLDKISVPKAAALTGQLLAGYPITIQLVQNESQAVFGSVKAAVVVQERDDGTKLYVGNLHPDMGESDLAPIFEACGDVKSLEIHKNHCCVVVYSSADEAAIAIEALNGTEVGGQDMMVRKMLTRDQINGQGPSLVSQGLMDIDTFNNMREISGAGPPIELSAESADDKTDGLRDQGIRMNNATRAQLMQKLLGNQTAGVPAPSAVQTVTQPATTTPLVDPGQPTRCLLIKNMFRKEEALENPDFDIDIREDVEDECEKFRQFGVLKHIFVDRDSEGHVFLRFDNKDAAKKVQEMFNGRFFGGQQLIVVFVPEPTYMLKYPKDNVHH